MRFLFAVVSAVCIIYAGADDTIAVVEGLEEQGVSPENAVVEEDQLMGCGEWGWRSGRSDFVPDQTSTCR